jgi:hypothetical protein
MDIFYIGNVLAVVIVAIMLLYFVFLIGWTIWWQPIDQFGQVSSITTEAYPFIPMQYIEFYGGAGNTILFDNRTSIVQPNIVCHVISHGLYLDSIDCKNEVE